MQCKGPTVARAWRKRKKRPEWAEQNVHREKYEMNERRRARKRNISFYSKCEGMPLEDEKVGFKEEWLEFFTLWILTCEVAKLETRWYEVAIVQVRSFFFFFKGHIVLFLQCLCCVWHILMHNIFIIFWSQILWHPLGIILWPTGNLEACF